MADEIFREIDEEMRRENLLKLWRRFRVWIISTVVTVIVFVAGGIGFVEYRQHQAEKMGDDLVTALATLEEAGAEASLDLFDELDARASSSSYEMLVLFNQAALAARTGDRRRAINLYNDLQVSAISNHWRDLATLLWAYYQLDSDDLESVATRLRPLLAPDRAWRYSAQEVMAFLEYRRGDSAASRLIFTQLSEDGQAPEGVRSRAGQMLSVLGKNKI